MTFQPGESTKAGAFRRMRTGVIAAFFGLLLSVRFASAGDASSTVPVPINELIAAIDNRDIQWDGTFFGLLPETKGASWLVAKHCSQTVSRQLLDALDDPDRFQAAHVLLGKVNRLPVSLSAQHYDGLRVVLNFDGTTVIDAKQRTQLKKLWTERLSTIAQRKPSAAARVTK